MSISVIRNLVFTEPSTYAADTTKTIGELRTKGRFYRHPDSALISYPVVVEKPLGVIKKDSLNVAVVGGGVGGIAAIYELSRLPDAKKKISVTLFESDMDHFASPTGSPLPANIDTHKKRSGRVFAAVSGSDTGYDKVDHAVYEIGAMRFPEIAGLTWHYASAVYTDTEPVTIFPNPGKVPTEFVHGEQVDRFIGSEWLDPNSPTKKLAEVVAHGMIGTKSKDSNISLFRIGGSDPAKITEELKSSNTTAERLAQIFEDWKVFAKQYNDLTLESAVSKVISARLPELPDVPGLPSKDCNQAKINHYVALFGRYGFGTGGFKPIFNTSLTEMMRLNLWEYSSEYSLPDVENVKFITKLYNKATPNLKEVIVERARVCDVCHLDEKSATSEAVKTSAAVLFYRKTIDGTEESSAQLKQYDYVIVAVTPKQASAISSRAGYENVARQVLLGDYKRQYKSTLNVRPPFVLSKEPGTDAANAQVLKAINQIHMVTSAKIFASIKKSEFDFYAPDFKTYGKIKAINSDCGLAGTYIVPSTVKPDYYSLLLSYSWEDDTKHMQNELLKYPINASERSDENRWMLTRIINRTIRDVLHPVSPTSTTEKPHYERWWFGELLKNADSKGELTDALSYDWTTHHTSGAFKLDVTGDHYNSNLLFRYHTHARQAQTLQNRFFLAGDSYSHLGGWIEGAFMSAVNAVCGLIVAANGGDIDTLTDVAQKKVITSFDSVV